ncbi:phosphoribosylanthranilate isomerase [Desulfitispora alkaliphila]|uniref:phosphoribosylanthranilate isomerase n=1 Tax=Desulfitispora alkaliphila TaxID=622674 RepID=UPI003D210549
MINIKICGIKSIQDAQVAIDAGADALGFVFAKGKNHINPEKAREICNTLPPFIATTGVFMDEERHVVQEISSFCNLDILQFHGIEAPEYCRKFTQRVIKAFSIEKEINYELINKYDSVSGVLLDGSQPGKAKKFNWDLIEKARLAKPLIIAGGINSDNIDELIERVRPYAIDVSSGATADGAKSYEKIKAIVDSARRTYYE